MIETDFAIIGGGPAGLSAAIEAANAGCKVTLIDENSRPGGQLFKQIHKFFGSKDHYAGTRGIDIGIKLLDDVEKAGVEVMLDTVAYGLYPSNTVGVVRNGENYLIKAKRILVATGGVENPLPFPGWTLPGVMGAGAIQTMVNVNRVLPGENILMVGSGNVGLIVSYQLLQAGANVVALIDAAPKIGGYAVHASKIRRRGVPIFTSTTIVEARGDNKVEEAVLVDLDEKWKPIPGTERTIKVDVICLAVGLSPLTELVWMSGAKFTFIPSLGGHLPLHDENMQTTIPGLYVAGDVAGVEEASTAVEEGRLVGVAVAHSLGKYTDEDAMNRKMVIRTRLDQLRSGPFGEGRLQAVQELVNRGKHDIN